VRAVLYTHLGISKLERDDMRRAFVFFRWDRHHVGMRCCPFISRYAALVNADIFGLEIWPEAIDEVSVY